MEQTHTLRTISPTVVSNPAGESFFDHVSADIVWPDYVSVNPIFKRQCQKQHAVTSAVQTLFATLPIGSSIAEGVRSGSITESAAGDFYHQLATYLEGETANGRIVLYVPLELSAPVVLQSPVANEASKRFQKAFRAAWLEQLTIHEVRANFVDGNVLEPELRTEDHPRVVKAIHLLPGLIAAGHISLSEAQAIVVESDDALLKENFTDVCNVLRAHSTHVPHTNDATSVAETCVQLRAAVAESATLNPSHSTPSRTAWLRKTARQHAIAKAAAKLADVLLQDKTHSLPREMSVEEQIACTDAVRQASMVDAGIYKQHRQWLTTVTDNQELTDARTKLYTHLHAQGIVDDAVLRSMEVRVPELAGPFSNNLPYFIPSTEELSAMAHAITDDKYVGERVFPVVLILGSQLKGYGIGDADADVAVFLKPTATAAESDMIAQKLRHIFRHQRIGGSVIMFWLQEKSGHLSITHNTQAAGTQQIPTWAHILLGGAWIGDEEIVTHLRHNLLTPYLFAPAQELDGWSLRDRWLEELERDTILYRLLHKGFERFFPILSPVDTPAGVAIDGNTAFYDPRFRRIATELYLSKVFLPNLGQSSD